MAGLVHFSNFFRYMEFAEARLFEQMGFPLCASNNQHLRGFPRVKAYCQYSAPLRFGETFRIELYIDAVGNHSITYSFRFRSVAEHPALIAKGGMTTVFASVDSPQLPLQIVELPDALRTQLESRLSGV